MTPLETLSATAKAMGVPVAAITGRTRTTYVCKARAAAARALRDLGLSLSEIGTMLGGRDHSTVAYILGADVEATA